MTDQTRRSRALIVDDDAVVIKVMGELLSREMEVQFARSGEQALQLLDGGAPDVILADIMMPGMDGFALLRKLRARSDLTATKIIMVSAKSYEFDRRRAAKLGSDGFIIKPIEADTFLPQVRRIVEDLVEVTFWGVRGTLPVPGHRALRYGGNTTCVSLEFPRGPLFVFDAGTGIKELSDHLIRHGRARLPTTIFITHPHWDHINALPFFGPLYLQGAEVQICGPRQDDRGIRDVISAQMDDVYWPITIKEFAASTSFRDLEEEQLSVEGIRVKTKFLSHPGTCLGYRIEYAGRSICVITDNELFLESSAQYDAHYVKRLTEFVSGTEALSTDCSYFDEDYAERRVGWGHSCVTQVAELAHRADVKNLYLIHHDPSQSDEDIDAKLEQACGVLEKLGSKTTCMAPSEPLNILV